MRFRQIFEAEAIDDLTHEILTTHFAHDQKSDGMSYRWYRGTKPADFDDLHKDLVTSGWKPGGIRAVHPDEGRYEETYHMPGDDYSGVYVETRPSDTPDHTDFSIMHRHTGPWKNNL